MSPATACIVCGVDDWHGKFQVLLECGSCGFMRADLEVDEARLFEIYGERYFNGEEYADYLADREVHRKNFEWRLRAMRRLAGDLSRVFEVGCAYGLWLEYLSAQGVDCAGVDICEDVAAYGRERLGQRAVGGDFLTLEIERGEYDAFVMWDTIEHLAHPEAFVARMEDLLEEGGWLFFTTGDIGSHNARRRGARWRMIHPPTHLQYFSRDTARQLLSGHGFEVRAAEAMPVYRNVQSTLANLRVLARPSLARLAGAADAVIPTRLAKKLGFWVDLGDIMFVAARKTGRRAA